MDLVRLLRLELILLRLELTDLFLPVVVSLRFCIAIDREFLLGAEASGGVESDILVLKQGQSLNHHHGLFSDLIYFVKLMYKVRKTSKSIIENCGKKFIGRNFNIVS